MSKIKQVLAAISAFNMIANMIGILAGSIAAYQNRVAVPVVDLLSTVFWYLSWFCGVWLVVTLVLYGARAAWMSRPVNKCYGTWAQTGRFGARKKVLMDDSKTISVFLDFPKIVEGGKSRGILPNKPFARAMGEAQEARKAGCLFTSLCTTACVIEAMVCYAAECKGWVKPIPKKNRSRRNDFRPALNYCKTLKGEEILQPLAEELKEYSENRNYIVHELLRLDKVSDKDRDLLDSLIELMDKLEGRLFSMSIGNTPGVMIPDHPEFFR